MNRNLLISNVLRSEWAGGEFAVNHTLIVIPLLLAESEDAK